MLEVPRASTRPTKRDLFAPSILLSIATCAPTVSEEIQHTHTRQISSKLFDLWSFEWGKEHSRDRYCGVIQEWFRECMWKVVERDFYSVVFGWCFRLRGRVYTLSNIIRIENIQICWEISPIIFQILVWLGLHWIFIYSKNRVFFDVFSIIYRLIILFEVLFCWSCSTIIILLSCRKTHNSIPLQIKNVELSNSNSE